MLNRASMDSIQIFSLTLSGKGLEIAPHFTLGEFASHCGNDMVMVHPKLVTGLMALREWAGVPVTINSSFRTPLHNSHVGGAAKSKHRLGQAADVTVENKTPSEVAAWAEGMGWGGVGRYDNFTHLDVSGEGRRWDNRSNPSL